MTFRNQKVFLRAVRYSMIPRLGEFFDQQVLFFAYVNQKIVFKALYYISSLKNIGQSRIKRQNLTSEIVKSLSQIYFIPKKRTWLKKVYLLQ